MRLKLLSTTFLLCLTSIAIKPAASQEIGEFWKPKDVIPFELTLDGPDADKATHAELHFSAKTLAPGQDGMQSGFGANGQHTKPHVFTFSVQIPEGIGTGEYVVSVTAGPSDAVNKAVPLPDSIARHLYSVRNDLHFSVGVKDLTIIPSKP